MVPEILINLGRIHGPSYLGAGIRKFDLTFSTQIRFGTNAVSDRYHSNHRNANQYKALSFPLYPPNTPMDGFQFVFESPQATQNHKKRPRLVTSCDNWYDSSSSSSTLLTLSGPPFLGQPPQKNQMFASLT